MLNAALKVLGGKQDGKLIPLATKKFLIGREQDCHLRPNSDSVSRHHCVITVDDFTVHVRDLGSSNGTFLNNIRLVGLREAKNGDRLRIGSLEFEIVARKGAPVAVATPVPSSTGSEFSISDFALPDVAPVEETALIAKTDTVVMKLSEVAKESAAASETIELPDLPEPLSESDTAVPELPTSPAVPDYSAPAAIDPMVAAQAQMPPGYDAAAMQAQAGMMAGYPYGQPQAYPGYGMPMQPQMGYPYGMPQQGYPYGMPQQGGYMPQQMPYGMPYPQGYPQQPYGYPQAMPGMPMPQMGQPEAAPEVVPVAPKVEAMPMNLPPPEETGYKPPVVQEQKSGDAPKAPAPNPAADVLKKMMQRR